MFVRSSMTVLHKLALEYDLDYLFSTSDAIGNIRPRGSSIREIFRRDQAMQQIRRVVILGGGSSGWMTASYLRKALPGEVKITLLESPQVEKIGVGEATVPNLQRVFFDFLGLSEDEWMRHCNGAFKTAVKFIKWRRPRGNSRICGIWRKRISRYVTSSSEAVATAAHGSRTA
jgi:hypothetical protein